MRYEVFTTVGMWIMAFWVVAGLCVVTSVSEERITSIFAAEDGILLRRYLSL
jgi:hypothetical protein